MSMIPCKVEGIVSRKEEDGFLLYNPLTDELHAVSHLGMAVLELCDGVNSVDDILAMLAFTNPLFLEEKAHASIMGFLEEMADRKLLDTNCSQQA